MRPAELKLSLLRFGLSLWATFSLLDTGRYTGWQAQPAFSALLFLGGFALTIILGCLSTIGYRCRWTSPIFAALILLLHLWVNFGFDAGHFLIHAQVFCALGLLMINRGRHDTYLSWGRPTAGSSDPTEDSRALTYFQIYIGSVYLFSGFAKLTSAYLSGHVLQAYFMARSLGSLPLPFPIPDEAFRLMSLSSIALEVTLPFFLWYRITRPWALVFGTIFHLGAHFFLQATFFTGAILFSYAAFVSDQALLRWIAVETSGED